MGCSERAGQMGGTVPTVFSRILAGLRDRFSAVFPVFRLVWRGDFASFARILAGLEGLFCQFCPYFGWFGTSFLATFRILSGLHSVFCGVLQHLGWDTG